MSSRELSEWMAFERIEPFGSQMDNFRAGQICAAIVNCNGGKDGRAVKASDFLPFFTGKTKQKNQFAMFKALAGK